MSATLLSLGAALLFASGHALQKHAVALRFSAGGASGQVPSGVGWIGQMVRRPLWVAGMVSILMASALDLQAVSVGDLTLVKPLLGLQAAFAVAIGVTFLGERVGRSEAAAVVALIAGGLLVAASFSPPRPEVAPHWSSTNIFLASALVAAGLVSAHQRFPNGLRGEAAYGLAAGLMFGVSDFMMKRATSIVVLAEGRFSVLEPASLWALVRTPEIAWIALANLGAFLAMQLAYARGRVSVISPLAGLSGTAFAVLLGFGVLQEPLSWSRAAGIALVVLATGLLVGARAADTGGGREDHGPGDPDRRME